MWRFWRRPLPETSRVKLPGHFQRALSTGIFEWIAEQCWELWIGTSAAGAQLYLRTLNLLPRTSSFLLSLVFSRIDPFTHLPTCWRLLSCVARHSCQHIADNLQQRYRNKVRPLFWIAARAKTSSAFTAAMDVIQKENNNAFLYLNDIDRKLWTRAYAPYPKWGHDTSNIIESLNSSWSDIRHLPPLQLIDDIYSTTIRMVYYRFKEPQKSALLANIPIAKFKAWQTAARQFRVFESGNGIYQVEESDSGRRFIVNLTETKCSCKNFYKYQSPCSHTIAAARHEEVDPISLFFDRYTVKALQKTYSYLLVPILLEALIIDTTI